MLPIEWSILPQVFSAICKGCGHPLISFFATGASVKLPLYTSPIQDLMVWKVDAFRHSWDDFDVYAFPLFTLLRQILSGVLISRYPYMILIAPLWSQNEWFVDLVSLLLDVHLMLPMPCNFLVQPHLQKFH